MIYTKQARITPEIAEKWLQKNTCNYRNLKPTKVALYAREMKDGRWEENGEAIKFYSDGTLFDGQHRLAAIVQAGVPVNMLVIWGIKKDVRACDIGSPRSSMQILKTMTDNPRTCNTAIIAMASRIVTNDLDTHKQAPRMETIDYIVKHQDLLSVLPDIVDKGKGHAISRNAACYLAAYIHLKMGTDPQIISKFFCTVNSGFGDAFVESSPAIVLRNLLINTKGSQHTSQVFLKVYANALFLLFDYAKQNRRRYVYSFDSDAQEYFNKLVKETEAAA